MKKKMFVFILTALLAISLLYACGTSDNAEDAWRCQYHIVFAPKYREW